MQQQLQVLNRRLEKVELEHKSLGERNRLLERLASMEDKKPTSIAKEAAPKSAPSGLNKKAATMATFINVLRRNKPPLATVDGLTEAVCQDMEPLKFEYVHNLASLLNGNREEELTVYVQSMRQARAEMMETFDIRDLPAEKLVKPGVFKQHTKNFPLPFKMSMVSIMGLSEAQKEDLLAAKRSMTIEFEAIISERKRSTAELKKNGETSPRQYCQNNHKHFVTELADGLSANDAFMNSLVAEHRCLMRFYKTCSEIITPLQEARCLVDGSCDGMWMDMWILPMIIEAERGNVLPSWLEEHYGRGTSNLTCSSLIGVDPYLPFPQPTKSEGGFDDLLLPGLETSNNSDNFSGSGNPAAQEGSMGYTADDFLSSFPLDFGTGFDNFEADVFSQFFPTNAT